MSNSIKCGKCKLYHALQRPNRKKDQGPINLKKGHCLDRTVYAKNKAGSPVFPPHAKVEDLPYNRHQIALVREDTVVPHCTAAKEG